MNDLHARTVFCVKDAQRSLSFYTNTLDCILDWCHEDEGKPFVFQVNMRGVELIINQIEDHTKDRAGHGRVFIGLDDRQLDAFRQYVSDNDIETEVVGWGALTLKIQDIDKNEIFVWLPEKDREALELGRNWP